MRPLLTASALLICIGPSPAGADDRPLCEKTWPNAAKPSAATTKRCIAHWSRYAYGTSNPDEEARSLDPTFGDAIEIRFTAAQFATMAAHTKHQCPKAECCSLCYRIGHWLETTGTNRFELTDYLALSSFEPLLKKVLAGEALTTKDLKTEHGPPWSPLTLWRLKNAVFARHGRTFGNPDLGRFFYGGKLGLRIDASYADARMTDVDRANVALLSGAL